MAPPLSAETPAACRQARRSRRAPAQRPAPSGRPAPAAPSRGARSPRSRSPRRSTRRPAPREAIAAIPRRGAAGHATGSWKAQGTRYHAPACARGASARGRRAGADPSPSRSSDATLTLPRPGSTRQAPSAPRPRRVVPNLGLHPAHAPPTTSSTPFARCTTPSRSTSAALPDTMSPGGAADDEIPFLDLIYSLKLLGFSGWHDHVVVVQ